MFFNQTFQLVSADKGTFKAVAPIDERMKDDSPYLVYKSKWVDDYNLVEGDTVLVTFKYFEKSESKRVVSVAPHTKEEHIESNSPDVDEKHNVAVANVETKKEIKGFWFPQEVKEVFNTANNMLENGADLVKILALGDSGFGKTSTAMQVASILGMDFIKVDCPTMSESTDFLGFMTAENGNVKFQPSQFSQALENGNTVILLDEITRTESFVLNVLMGLLDDSKTVHFMGHDIKVGNNIILVATANVGSKFSGTFELDPALTSRFDLNYNVGPLPFDKEVDVLKERIGINRKTADKIATLANSVRDFGFDVVWSTRTSLQIATLVKNGMSLRNAIQNAYINGLEQDDAKTAEDYINMKAGMLTYSTFKNDIFGDSENQSEEEKKEDIEIKIFKGGEFVSNQKTLNLFVEILRKYGIQISDTDAMSFFTNDLFTAKIKKSDYESLQKDLGNMFTLKYS